MADVDAPPLARLHGALDRAFERFRLAPAITIGVLNVTGGILLSLVGDVSTAGGLTRAIIGGVLLVAGLGVGVVVEWWRWQTSRAQSQESAQFSVAVSNVLQPLSSRISALALNDSPTRQRQLEAIISDAASSLLLLFKHVDTPRATVYRLDKGGRKMTPTYHCGRTDKPGAFKDDGGGRGAGAFDMVRTGGSKLVESMQDPDKKYRGYVSAAVICDDMGYGMITVDSLAPDEFSPADEQLVVLIATLLGAAFGGTFRTRDGLKLTGN